MGIREVDVSGVGDRGGSGGVGNAKSTTRKGKEKNLQVCKTNISNKVEKPCARGSAIFPALSHCEFSKNHRFENSYYPFNTFVFRS